MHANRLDSIATVLDYLPQDYSILAEEHDVLRLQHGNAKITCAKELLRLFFVHVGLDLPLRQTAALVREAGGPDVSPMRIHKKLIRSGTYLNALLQRMVPQAAERSLERWMGYRPMVIDATTLVGPGATGADARIHTVMDLTDLRIARVDVTDERGGESLTRFEWQPTELVIADRGYSHAAGIAHATGQGAAVLIRLNWHSVQLEWSDDEDADVPAWLHTLEGNGCHQKRAYVVTPSGEKVSGRVIARKLKPEESLKALDRLSREHSNKDISLEMVDAAGYVVLFTTSDLTASECIELYRLRWQIELAFKRWKSLGGFDRLPNYRDDTIRSWIYLKLILGSILEKIASTTEAFPPDGSGRAEA